MSADTRSRSPIKIKNCAGGVLFSGEYESLRECAEAAAAAGKDLSGANLIEADLSEANLSGANLIEADLSEANLSEANLIKANLREADLSGANLRGANLRGANLRGANLRGADLSGANLRGANLRGASLIEANLSGANLSETNLRWASLRGANLRGASLIEANLSGADLRGASLIEANLSEANLSGANLSGANLRGADLIDAGQDARGFRFWAWRDSAGSVVYRAGCHEWASLDEALDWYGDTYSSDGDRHECIARLRLLSEEAAHRWSAEPYRGLRDDCSGKHWSVYEDDGFCGRA